MSFMGEQTSLLQIQSKAIILRKTDRARGDLPVWLPSYRASLSLLSSLLPTDSDVSDTGNALRPFVGV